MAEIEKDDGGAAFPHMMATGHRDYAGGMSLRDWFAGQALPEIIRIASAGELEALDGERAGQAIARSAYEAADAMLAERAKAEPRDV